MMTLAELQQGGKRALAEVLARVEEMETRGGFDAELIALLDTAFRNGAGHVIGLTGPPGVGKSTLVNAMIAEWRVRELSVGVIAVDPSSKHTGGALLGDRTRIVTDPEDSGVFMRSMAARDRLGGLASLTVAASVLMRACYDWVIVETVGVGQSETEISGVADTVIFCVQPGSGDALQYMKAGIMEVPHIALVTKADMGVMAQRAQADVEGALSLSDAGQVQILQVSAISGLGVDHVLDAIEAHRENLEQGGTLQGDRREMARGWTRLAVREMFGRDGARRLHREIAALTGEDPFGDTARLAGLLARDQPQ